MRRTVCFVVLASLLPACTSEPLPDPLPLHREPDKRGYPIVPRPVCSPAIAAAMRNNDADLPALVAAAERGESVTCGSAERPLPLDWAVMLDAPEVVRALLDAGADPNARWGLHGDRFALQDAIEEWRGRMVHRREIIALLLQHGADPNQRWCPFESRAETPYFPACESAMGATPLIAAATRDQADTAYLLLDAGADPHLRDGWERTALDYASGRAVFELLLTAQFPDPTRREMAPAFTGAYVNGWVAPPPPPPPPQPPSSSSSTR